MESWIRESKHWVLHCDVQNCFDSIDRDLLIKTVSTVVEDVEIIKLIRNILRSGICEGVSVHEEYRGVNQGNVLSPILANVYLHKVDEVLTQQGFHLVRYADDLVVLEESQDRVGRALVQTFEVLESLRLKAGEKKTRVQNVREGFVFLGFLVDHRGKGPAVKALAAIQKRLDDLPAV